MQIAERKVVDTASGPVAGLLSRAYIVVREPERDYTGEGWLSGGREFPFRTVRITTVVTPDLAGPLIQPGVMSRKVGVQDSAGAQVRPFPFHLIATDVSGAQLDFTAGMYWIDQREVPKVLSPAQTGYGSDEEKFEKLWPATHRVREGPAGQ